MLRGRLYIRGYGKEYAVFEDKKTHGELCCVGTYRECKAYINAVKAQKSIEKLIAMLSVKSKPCT